MRTIKVKSITFAGFKGQNIDLSFGDFVEIRGKNGQGKSTIYSSLLWLLTGADELDRSNFDLFDYFSEFTPEEAGKADVFAVFDIDGVELRLRRTAKQKWVMSRESSKFTKAPNDDYVYFVNDIEVSKKKYDDTIESYFAPMGKLKIMLNHDYWSLLDWKELRNHFMDIVGEISDDDFAGDYSDVIDDIKSNGAEDAKLMYHKLITDKEKGYNRQIADISGSINALRETLPNLDECDGADEKISELNKEISCIEANLLGFQGANDEIIAKRRQEECVIDKKRAELRRAMHEYEESQSRKLKELEQSASEARRMNRTISQRREVLNRQIGDFRIRIKNTEERIGHLREEYKIIKSRMFDGVCPECGGQYNGNKRTEAFQRFCDKKESDIETNVKEGKSAKAILDELAIKMADAEKELSETKLVNETELDRSVYDFKRSMRTFDGSDQEAEIERLESEKTVIPENPDVTEMLKRKGDINEEIRQLYEIAALRKVHAETMEKIKKNSHRLDVVLQAKNACEKKEMLVEQYINEQNDIIRMRANRYFPETACIVMQKRKKDGSMIPTCEIWYKGKNAYGTNTAERREAGRIISEAFQRAYGVIMPLYIDNANDFDSDHTPRYEGQLFLAYVDDCELTVTSK